MTNQKVEKKWFALRHKFLKEIGKKPDIDAFLFLIGIQEVGQVKNNFKKEEKQDLMHVAVSLFLEKDGLGKYMGYDDQNWPHWELIANPPKRSRKDQEEWLKSHIVRYFEEA